MRIAPRTPNAGSTRVSCEGRYEPKQGRDKERARTRTIGAGDGELEAEAEEVAEAEADVAVGVRVRVTLKVVGTTVWTWVRTPFERMEVVRVAEAVVRDRAVGRVEGWADEREDGADDEEGCWARAAAAAAMRRRILMGVVRKEERRRSTYSD